MPKRHLHKSDIVVAVVTILLLVLIGVPGRVVDYQTGLSKTFEHGWPFTYLRRQTDETIWTNVNGMNLTLSFTPNLLNRRDSLAHIPMFGIPWLSPESWAVWEFMKEDNDKSKWQFRLAALAIDAALAVVVLVVAVAAWEFRRRRRPRVLSFTLADLFFTITFVSIVMGYLIHLRHGYVRETKFDRQSSVPNLWCEEGCIAPVWLKSLVGERFMPNFTWRVTSVSVTGLEITDPNALPVDLANFPYLSTLEISGTFGGNGRFPYSVLRSLPQLTTLKLDSTPRLDGQDVRELSELTGLRSLILDEQSTISFDLIPPPESRDATLQYRRQRR